jgi:hypothetical protein
MIPLQILYFIICIILLFLFDKINNKWYEINIMKNTNNKLPSSLSQSNVTITINPSYKRTAFKMVPSTF